MNVFERAYDDVKAFFAKLPSQVQAFINKLASDEYQQVVIPAAQEALKDVETGGFTTAAFVQAGKDVVAIAASKGVVILISDAMALLNAMVTLPAVAAQTVPDAEVSTGTATPSDGVDVETPKDDAGTVPVADSVSAANS